ncbi:MAG: amylo-alpha-1,6-glucosidase [Epsilonproteobacteria bacterium]|nr:amylo-alpha-1,6-glucosidase [Campylobacterota bacterium]
MNNDAVNKFCIIAQSPTADEFHHILKYGDLFIILNRYGNIQPVSLTEGLYYKDTRFLSKLELRFADALPLFLSSAIKSDNTVLTVDLTNPDIWKDDKFMPRGSIYLNRTKFLFQNRYYERIKLSNYGISRIHLPISLYFNADFKDIFEVRGAKREKRGKKITSVKDKSIKFIYKGLDKIIRKTKIEFSKKPAAMTPLGVSFNITLEPKEKSEIFLTVSCETDDNNYSELTYNSALKNSNEILNGIRETECTICTSNEQFNSWINRSMADIHTMITDTSCGFYPYAGIPWFSTVFGRDGIISAFECLWINPAIAKGVLNYLAGTQAKKFSDEYDAEPGKIVHEIRKGEMANLDEIPFGQYYGSIDSTPLFIILAASYYDRTGDIGFIKSIWDNIEAATEWIDKYGDIDGDGFVEYIRRRADGLIQQGWKDSADSIFYKDGTVAKPPIALCEVQAYVYSAKLGTAKLARLLGYSKKSSDLLKSAEKLRRKFEDLFWIDEISTYALALDGDKRPCKVKTSNAGHSLFAGIASHSHAKKIAELLVSPELFSGWGIRTLSDRENRYNPISYHNGSVWPHDNALIAYGLSRYGFKEEVLKILTCLHEADSYFNLQRLPELFCGFERKAGRAPTLYPVACPIQAWSAASVFMLLQASLGLHIDAEKSIIMFDKPVLPNFLQWVKIKNLRIGNRFADLHLQRSDLDVGINVVRKQGSIEIVVIK